MNVSLEDFITKKIALSVEGFSNESIKMVIDEMKDKGEVNWITLDAEQSFYACNDRPRYLFIQFSPVKEPQLNWNSCFFSNFWIARPISDLWLEPTKKLHSKKRYRVSVYKATHYPGSIFYGQAKEKSPTWLVEHDGEEVSRDQNGSYFTLTYPSSHLVFNWYWVEEKEEQRETEKENDKN